jgi:hypothetical protein
VSNVSSRSCALAGYPTLALLDRSGRALPFGYRHDGDQMIGSRAVDYCGRADPGHVVSVSAIEARFLGAFCISQTSCRRR